MEVRGSFWQRIGGFSTSSSDSPPTSRQSRITTSAGGRRGSKVKVTSLGPPSTVFNQRSLLHDYLLKSNEEPHLESVTQLGRLCLEESESSDVFTCGPTDLIYYSALLLQWSNSRGDELTPIYYRKLAGAHYEAWKTRGVIGEADHLKYALAAYEKGLKSPEISSQPEVWLEYSKVLMHLGEAELGLKTITSMIRQFDEYEHQGIFYLTAGAMLSSIGKHEQAGQYYFEAIQIGMPKFFTKSDLMFILSRSFEQLGFETKSAGAEPVEEGYIMVFSHMVAEKSDESSLTYHDWISSYETWRDIGDKCAMHGLFSLAADLYGQGLVRDKRAFLRSSLWFKFAKSCFRCGRTSDAQLAVKQAVTLDPQNTQCALALRTWSKISTVVVDLIEGPLLPILQLLPPPKNPTDVAATIIQAFYRGQSLRFCGRGRVKVSPPLRRLLMKSLSATTTVMLRQGELSYPMLMKIRPDWRGDISRIKIFNIHTDTMGMIVLKTQFRLPNVIYDPSFTYSLSLSCQLLKQPSLRTGRQFDETDSDEETPLTDSIPDDGNSHGGDDLTPSLYLLVMKFAEKETGFYMLRQLYLTLSDDGSLSTIETSVDVYCPRFHNPNLIELPPYLEDSTVLTELVTEGPSYDDLQQSEEDAPSIPYDSTSTIEQLDEVATSQSWEPTVTGEDSVATVETLMSLFTPYRPRRGMYRYFGTLFLYNATFINNNHNNSEVLSTPSAKAIHEANYSTGLQQRNTLQIRCLQVNNGRRILFILPPRLAVMENIDDIFPILLGSVQELPGIALEGEGEGDGALPNGDAILTPRRHGVSLLNGTLKLFVKATQSNEGEIIIRLEIPQSNQVVGINDDNVNHSEEEEFLASIRRVLAVHQNKNQAWNQLQDHVCRSLDTSEIFDERSQFLDSLDEEESVLRKEEEDISSLDSLQNDDKKTKGRIQVGDCQYLYHCYFANEKLVISLQFLPENDPNENSENDRVVNYFLAPRQSSLNHLPILLPTLALRFHEFVPVGAVVIVTSEDNSQEDMKYIDAVHEFLNPSLPLTVTELSQMLVNSWIAKILQQLFPSTNEIQMNEDEINSETAITPTNQVNPDQEKERLLELERQRQQEREKEQEQALKQQQQQQQQQEKQKEQQERHLLIESFTSSIFQESTDVIANKIEEDRRLARKGIALKVAKNCLQIGFERVWYNKLQKLLSMKEFAQTSTLRPVVITPAMTSSEMDHKSSFNPFELTPKTVDLSDLPCISLEDLLDPFDESPELEDYMPTETETGTAATTTANETDKPLPIVQLVNVQAAFFLAFQEQRLSCLDYLADRAVKAKHQVTRQLAFKYLKERVELSQLKLENKQNIGIRKQSTTTKKKVAVNEAPPEVITDLSMEELIEISPTDSKTKRHVTRQYSAPQMKDKSSKEKRRGSMPAAVSGKHHPLNTTTSTSPGNGAGTGTGTGTEADRGTPPTSAQQLHTLLDLQLKDESFTESPQDLVEALQLLSTDIPSVCASPRFMALAQRSPQTTTTAVGASPSLTTNANDTSIRPFSTESDKRDPSFSPKDRSPLRRSPSILTSYPSNKISEWDTKIETMKSANGLAPIGMGKRNPIDFLDEMNSTDPHSSTFSNVISSEPMFEESISNYLHKGYSTGTCAYLAIWKNKIIHCIKTFSSPLQLNKSIYSLQRAYPEPLTRAGALCALSETNGSVGEALGQLNDKTFKHELILVCQALPLEEIVNRLSEYKKQQKTSNYCEKTIEDLLNNTQIMRNNQEKIRGGGGEMELSAADHLSFDESPRHFISNEFRFPTEISRSLPHHGMGSTSPTVLSRGNLVRRTRDHVKGGGTGAGAGGAPVAVRVANSSIHETEETTHLPPIEKSILSKSLNSLPSRSDPHQQQSHQSLLTSNTATTTSSNKIKHKKNKNHFSSKVIQTAGTAPPKFTRVGKTIDMLAEQSDSLVIMSRLDAYRAQEEELLLKYHPEQESYFRSSKQKKFLGKLSPVEFSTS